MSAAATPAPPPAQPHRTALITGATGFLGGTLAHHLRAEGCSVVGLDDLGNSSPDALPLGIDRSALGREPAPVQPRGFGVRLRRPTPPSPRALPPATQPLEPATPLAVTGVRLGPGSAPMVLASACSSRVRTGPAPGPLRHRAALDHSPHAPRPSRLRSPRACRAPACANSPRAGPACTGARRVRWDRPP